METPRSILKKHFLENNLDQKIGDLAYYVSLSRISREDITSLLDGNYVKDHDLVKYVCVELQGFMGSSMSNHSDDDLLMMFAFSFCYWSQRCKIDDEERDESLEQILSLALELVRSRSVNLCIDLLNMHFEVC